MYQYSINYRPGYRDFNMIFTKSAFWDCPFSRCKKQGRCGEHRPCDIILLFRFPGSGLRSPPPGRRPDSQTAPPCRGGGSAARSARSPPPRSCMRRMRSRDLTNLTYACINHHVHWGAGSFPAETSESKLDTHRPDPDNAGVGNEIYIFIIVFYGLHCFGNAVFSLRRNTT